MEIAVAINDRGKVEKNDIVFSVSKHISEVHWVEMLIRGTHNIPNIPFHPKLFNLYFKRIKVYNIFRKPKTIEIEATCPARELKNTPSIFYRDKVKSHIPVPIPAEMIKFVKEFYPDFDFGLYPFGSEDKRINSIFGIEESEFKSRDEIEVFNLRDDAGKFGYKLDILKHKKDLGLDIKAGKKERDLFGSNVKWIDLVVNPDIEVSQRFQARKNMIESK